VKSTAYWRLYTACPRCGARAGSVCRAKKSAKKRNDAYVPYHRERVQAADRRMREDREQKKPA